MLVDHFGGLILLRLLTNGPIVTLAEAGKAENEDRPSDTVDTQVYRRNGLQH